MKMVNSVFEIYILKKSFIGKRLSPVISNQQKMGGKTNLLHKLPSVLHRFELGGEDKPSSQKIMSYSNTSYQDTIHANFQRT